MVFLFSILFLSICNESPNYANAEKARRRKLEQSNLIFDNCRLQQSMSEALCRLQGCQICIETSVVPLNSYIAIDI